MTTTNFVDGVTLTAADWFNDVDALTYEGTFPTGATAVKVTGATTLAVFNTVATTVNAFGAATTLNIGAATGTLTVNNTTLAAKAITASTTLGVTGLSTLSGGIQLGQLVSPAAGGLSFVSSTLQLFMGTSGFQLVNSGNTASRITVTDAGDVTVANGTITGKAFRSATADVVATGSAATTIFTLDGIANGEYLATVHDKNANANYAVGYVIVQDDGTTHAVINIVKGGDYGTSGWSMSGAALQINNSGAGNNARASLLRLR